MDIPLSKCSHCNKASESLKRCAKCKSVAYCDRDCQKAHWKAHKEDCTLSAAVQDPSSLFPNGEIPKRSKAKPFTAIYFNNFLHDRSEKLTFKILIDLIRMRQDDEYTLGGDTMPGTIYNGEASSKKAFCDFLRRAKDVEGFLPPWWTEEKAKECVRFGLHSKNFNLKAAQEKADIQETWGDQLMPMKLRMLGEKVYGYTPGGTRAEPMLAQNVVAEAGLGFSLNMDHISGVISRIK